YTNNIGIATIQHLASGVYSVSAKYAGYSEEIVKDVKVESGKITELTFRLGIKMSDTTISHELLSDQSKVDIGSKPMSKTFQGPLSPGVVADGSNGGMAMRGSRGAMNSEHINGIASSKFSMSEIDVNSNLRMARPGPFNTAE